MDKRLELRRCAEELFAENGFKDTNVSDITKKAGFATGTFYNYYTSKEALFMEIFNEENVKLKRSILQSVDLNADPMQVMNEMMAMNMQGITANPILRESYNRDVFMKIEKNFRENGLKHVDFMYGGFVEIAQKWQAEGKIRKDIDAQMIMAIFASLICVETHKEEIGFEYFPQVLEYLSEFTMKGLMT